MLTVDGGVVRREPFKQIGSLLPTCFGWIYSPVGAFHIHTKLELKSIFICGKSKFTAGSYGTNSEGFPSVGSNSCCVSPELNRNRRLPPELWSVKYPSHPAAGGEGQTGSSRGSTCSYCLFGDFRESHVRCLLPLLL